MNEIWTKVLPYCGKERLVSPYDSILVTHDDGKEWHWLIGPHPQLSALATNLRSKADLCMQLRKMKVRFGFRVSPDYPADLPPLGLERQERYGPAEKLKPADHTEQRKNQLYTPAKEIKQSVYGTEAPPPPKWRKGDEFANVARYWASQTPQAHHIVEYNNLEALGLSKLGSAEDLDYDCLPCVLLMAEFHQRYFSSALKRTHSVGTKKLNTSQQKLSALGELEEIYRALYEQSAQGRSETFPFRSLWQISEVIFAAARKKLGG